LAGFLIIVYVILYRKTHHTDSTREYKYDLHTISGHLETALDEAKLKGWLVVDMQKDFKKIFSFE
jgi:hypothetical protein